MSKCENITVIVSNSSDNKTSYTKFIDISQFLSAFLQAYGISYHSQNTEIFLNRYSEYFPV